MCMYGGGNRFILKRKRCCFIWLCFCILRNKITVADPLKLKMWDVNTNSHMLSTCVFLSNENRFYCHCELKCECMEVGIDSFCAQNDVVSFGCVFPC